MLDLWRIRFKDGIKAADSRLVWATSQESAEALGKTWCEPRGYRFVGTECETVAREGKQVEAPASPVGRPLPPATLTPTAPALK